MQILTDRQEMAQAINFGKYPVLQFDVDKDEGSKVVVIKKSERYGDMRYRCQLFRGKIKADDGIFYLLTKASMISATVGVDDWLENVEYANAPVIKPEQEVAILIHSKKTKACVVQIVKAGKIDPTYSTATTFLNEW